MHPSSRQTRFTEAFFILAILVATGMGAGSPSASPGRESSPAVRPVLSPSTSSEGLPSRESLIGLRFFRPYERGKIPVVLVHGLWGRRENWEAMISFLDQDPVIRNRYQFWTYEYPTTMTIADSAGRLEATLKEARRILDPSGDDPAFGRMVLVGHSMGGLLAKAVANSPSDDRVSVGRLVYITTPHKGTRLANIFLGRSGKKPFKPGDFEIVEGGSSEPAWSRGGSAFETSIDQLVEGHPVLMALDASSRNTSTPFHSIIADLGHARLERGSDGIVPYRSSHAEGAESELVVPSGHLCLGEPSVILEVRRILESHRESIDREELCGAISPASRASHPCRAEKSGVFSASEGPGHTREADKNSRPDR